MISCAWLVLYQTPTILLASTNIIYRFEAELWVTHWRWPKRIFTCWNGISPCSNINRHAMNSMSGQYCSCSPFSRMDRSMMVSWPPIYHSVKSGTYWTRRIRKMAIFESSTRFNLVSNSLTWLSRMTTDIWQHLFSTSPQRNPTFFRTHQIIHVMFIAIFHMLLEGEGRICSNEHDFTIERIRIDMSLLLNEYPRTFIT
jgi:hypothetical protein